MARDRTKDSATDSRATSKNIDVSGSSFARNLKVLRTRAKLTKAELAERTGLVEKTIRDCEKGRRRRVQENTLFSLAQFFGISVDELIGRSGRIDDDSADKAPPRWKSAAAAALLLVVLAASGTAWVTVGSRPEIHVDGRTIRVTRGPLKLAAWTETHPSTIRTVSRTPWENVDAVAYGLSSHADGGGALFVRELSSGKLLWKDEPRLGEIASVYGDRMAGTGGFHCHEIFFADLHGDGAVELVCHHMHDTFYPAYISTYRSDGTRLGAYYHYGHLNDFEVADIDADGKEEIIAAGTNNARCYQGATVILFDDFHCSGASADSLVWNDRSARDSSLARVIFPQFREPFMELLHAERLEADDLRTFTGADGRRRIAVSVGVQENSIMVVLDERLRPLSMSPSDNLVIVAKTWPGEAREVFLQSRYLDEWFSDHLLFASGRRVSSGEAAADTGEPSAAP